MNYWLMKSEPGCYSITDLEKEKIAPWDGVRNYQARNFMKNDMSIGDLVLFYHSNAKPSGVAGIARVCSKPYPDSTAFDPSDEHYDPKSDKKDPRWFLVDVEFVEKFSKVIPLPSLREIKDLQGMLLLKKGCRLSVQPVSKKHFILIKSLAIQTK